MDNLRMPLLVSPCSPSRPTTQKRNDSQATILTLSSSGPPRLFQHPSLPPTWTSSVSARAKKSFNTISSAHRIPNRTLSIGEELLIRPVSLIFTTRHVRWMKCQDGADAPKPRDLFHTKRMHLAARRLAWRLPWLASIQPRRQETCMSTFCCHSPL